MTVDERYVTARELAAIMGVSERTIKRMVAAGMPSETWGMSRTRRFQASEAIAWARTRPRQSTDVPAPDRSIVTISDNQPGRRANAVMGSDHQGCDHDG